MNLRYVCASMTVLSSYCNGLSLRYQGTRQYSTAHHITLHGLTLQDRIDSAWLTRSRTRPNPVQYVPNHLIIYPHIVQYCTVHAVQFPSTECTSHCRPAVSCVYVGAPRWRCVCVKSWQTPTFATHLSLPIHLVHLFHSHSCNCTLHLHTFERLLRT